MGLSKKSLRRDAYSDATLSQQASSLGVVGDWAAARALCATRIVIATLMQFVIAFTFECRQTSMGLAPSHVSTSTEPSSM
jgi:hypothetical protein